MVTLRQCEHVSRDALVVPSPAAVRLPQIAGQTDCRWIGRLPEHFDRSRYWCQADEVLTDEFDECWVLRLTACLQQRPEYGYFLHQGVAHWLALLPVVPEPLAGHRPRVLLNELKPAPGLQLPDWSPKHLVAV